MFTDILLVIALLGTLTSTAYLLLVLAGVCGFVRQRREALTAVPEFAPGVSILKPVHGLETDLEENLESFFRQDYSDFELIFCARHADDPALLLAQKMAKRHPRVPVRILTSGEPPWTNAKLYSLEAMWKEARHDLLVISDSDVRVSPNYLRELVKPFVDPRVGMGTCIYRGRPGSGFWTQLEALGMSVEMTSGVLVANLLEGMKFALGPTMIVRRECIDALNGFSFMAEFCADDYILGNSVAESGMKVVLSHLSVDHIVVHHSLASSLRHQVRWMRSTRFSRPKGHLGTVLTYAMPFGLLGLVAGVLGGRAAIGISLFAVAVGNRILQSIAAGYMVAGDRNALTRAWLYPVRDLLGAGLWLASYFGSTIEWRGESYRLAKAGRMLRAGGPVGIAASAKATEVGASPR
jgi:ceramide glucosyltransferase